MTGWWLREAVAACGLSPPRGFPREMREALLPLHVRLLPLARLSTAGVRDWLIQKGIHHKVADIDRPLHGCMVARAGCGFFFYDEEDDEREQRFSLAHEAAHFTLEHLLPRFRALRAMGEEIRPVLDGKRTPTPEETLSSVLEGIPFGVHVRLMERDSSGSIRMRSVEEAEQRADRLALELLAPALLALKVLQGVPRELAGPRVASYFGLPLDVARMYAGMLLGRARTPRFSIQDLLGEVGSCP